MVASVIMNCWLTHDIGGAHGRRRFIESHDKWTLHLPHQLGVTLILSHCNLDFIDYVGRLLKSECFVTELSLRYFERRITQIRHNRVLMVPKSKLRRSLKTIVLVVGLVTKVTCLARAIRTDADGTADDVVLVQVQVRLLGHAI